MLIFFFGKQKKIVFLMTTYAKIMLAQSTKASPGYRSRTTIHPCYMYRNCACTARYSILSVFITATSRSLQHNHLFLPIVTTAGSCTLTEQMNGGVYHLPREMLRIMPTSVLQ